LISSMCSRSSNAFMSTISSWTVALLGVMQYADHALQAMHP
jgi:hypothetical protein